MGGYEGKGGQGVGKIWKNEEVLYSNSSSSSLITDIFISGKDVYSVGNEFDGKTTNATIWKNGIATILGNKVKSSSANAIFVLGNDVYVCGSQDDTKGNTSAIIWKNGVASVIDLIGELYTIFVSGSDVYASGETGVYPTGGFSIFKNGKSIYFEKQGGFPTGMFVSGNDVYVSGYGTGNGMQAKLWKNGVVTIIDKIDSGVGGDVSANDAKELAQLCALNALAAISLVAELDQIERVVRVGGFVNCAPGFTAIPGVVNGASELLIKIFGDVNGKHARTAVGVAELPLNAPVEIELIVQIKN